MRIIEPSELIINPDGTIFHLHLAPGQIADRVILVGDPARVGIVSGMFDSVESRSSSREFVSATGRVGNTPLTVLSTGIGTDNIDIVMTELDALVNIDFLSRSVREKKRKLSIVRLGTSGAIQPDIELGTCLLSEISIGFDGLLGFYEGRDTVCDREIERAFIEHMEWNPLLATPYFVKSSERLNRILSGFTLPGMTISAPGFYAPQGRVVRLGLNDPLMNAKIEAFSYGGRKITNYEMESSAIAGLAALMGHDATTVCAIIAQRAAGKSNADYGAYIRRMTEEAITAIISG